MASTSFSNNIVSNIWYSVIDLCVYHTYLYSLQELSPPLVDDFLYLCDDAYTHDDLLKMERDILKTVGYDINIPVAYRFIRRLARVSGQRKLGLKYKLEFHTFY